MFGSSKPAEKKDESKGVFGGGGGAPSTGGGMFGGGGSKPAGSSMFGGSKPATDSSAAPKTNPFGANPNQGKKPSDLPDFMTQAKVANPAFAGKKEDKPKSPSTGGLFNNASSQDSKKSEDKPKVPKPSGGLFGAKAGDKPAEKSSSSAGLFGGKPKEAEKPASKPAAGGVGGFFSKPADPAEKKEGGLPPKAPESKGMFGKAPAAGAKP